MSRRDPRCDFGVEASGGSGWRQRYLIEVEMSCSVFATRGGFHEG